MEAARRFEAQERKMKLVSKKAWEKRIDIQKNKFLDTPYESNIY